MLAILGWILFGLVVGILAKALMPGRDPNGLIITIVLGIVGSIIGGFVGQAVFGYGRNVNTTNDFTEPSFLMSLILSVVGSIILLAIYRLLTGRSLRA